MELFELIKGLFFDFLPDFFVCPYCGVGQERSFGVSGYFLGAFILLLFVFLGLGLTIFTFDLMRKK
jgi:hypothetical protein